MFKLTSLAFKGYTYDYYNDLRDANVVRSSPSVNMTQGNSSVFDNTTMAGLNTTVSPPVVTDNVTLTNVTSSQNSAPNYTYHKKSEWEIPEVRTNFVGFIDTIFVWFRYIHFTIVPIIIFAIHKVSIDFKVLLRVSNKGILIRKKS